jgi:hypothetical protein
LIRHAWPGRGADGVVCHVVAHQHEVLALRHPLPLHASDSSTTRWTQATAYPDMWVDPDDDPRETDAEPVGEHGLLLEYLRTYRLTPEMKCAGLDAEQMARRSVPPSTMSLLCSGWCGT